MNKKSVPNLHSRQVTDPNSRNSAARRPVSSVYSQPSPTMQTHQQPKIDIPRSSSIYPDDVSPPDSPRAGDGARTSSPNVSPITDAGSGHRLSSSSRPYASNIPLPKQKASGGTTAFISNWKEKLRDAQAAGSGKMKWDDYSGEPTGSDKGRMGQVIPAVAATQFDKPGMGVRTTVTSQPPATKSIFGTTLKKVPRKDKNAPSPPPKEEWKGASGRAPIVPPVQNKPDPRGTKKSFPTPSQRRMKQGSRQATTIKSSPEDRSPPAHALGKSSPRQMADRATHQKLAEVAEDFDRNAFEGSDMDTLRHEYTDSPLNIPARTDSIGVFDHGLGKGDPLPSSNNLPEVREPSPTVRKVATEPIAKKPLLPEISQRTTSLPPANDFLDEQLYSAVHQLDLHNEPASRFSATTYNTTIQDSPDTPKRSFDEPDLPPVPDSILNRKRPVPVSGSFGRSKPPSRKPTPSELTHIDSEGKSLPQQPPEETIVDRVILLEAKLNSLHKRKQNLQTVIHELTNVVQPSSAAYDKASRQEIKKTVEGLQTESATIVKEIHETGLKLHRALKKRDESSSYEPTGLWVRRVTE